MEALRIPSRTAMLFLLLLVVLNAGAQIPDWSSQVASIIYNHCSTCHHDGGIAPFPLMSYDDAVNNAWSIQADVNAGKMPPWPPDASFNHFRNEKILSQIEIDIINSWVNNNTPSGNLANAPAPPVFNGNSLMTSIDDVIVAPVYTIQKNTDEYRSFVIHSNYTETRYLNQVEFIPGNASAVHHVFLLQDTSDYSNNKDLEDPGPGYNGGGFGDVGPSAEMLCGWIPGSDMITLPGNMGFVVPPGADFVLSFHYAPGSMDQADSTRVNLHFSTDPNVRKVRNERLISWFKNSLLNPPFLIPANEVKTFYNQSKLFDTDQSLIAVQPHMHLIGKSYKVFMVTTPGDTTNLIYIPNWNFYWQLNYFFTKVIKFPANTQIFGSAVYDNTINNPFNPSNPPEDVRAGESTFDEMMGCRFSILDYQPGDENIILDTAFYEAIEEYNDNTLAVSISPNPASDKLYMMAVIPEHQVIWKLVNETGAVIKQKQEKGIPSGMYPLEIAVDDIESGIYFLSVSSGGKSCLKKIVVMH
ncbi:MAG TPA: T9SS type A sorting domain-containing protein [Chitinophagales bacterium]|nr:T9SS type A sorting domain-containing protein [Chitinophagales bacterium]